MLKQALRMQSISIHAPRVGRDNDQRKEKESIENFNPRAPCGARRDHRVGVVRDGRFQSTRPVWGATAYMRKYRAANYISIHAPRVGRDKRQPRKAHQPREFQSTRPVWGATATRSSAASLTAYFNPRAPCGARPCDTPLSLHFALFQSTRPVWGATQADRAARRGSRISIHAPRVGRDT